jgi:hypothetical protein
MVMRWKSITPKTIEVWKSSIVSEKEHRMILAISSKEFKSGLRRWSMGELIQNCFPSLDASEREFLITGITPEEWDANDTGEEE